MWPGHMPLIPPEVSRESLEKWLRTWRSKEPYISKLYPQETLTLTDTPVGANYRTFRNDNYHSNGPKFSLRCRIHGPAIKNYRPLRSQSRPFAGVYELKVASDGSVQGWLPAPPVQSCYEPIEFRADLKWFFPPRVVVLAVRYDRDSTHTDIFFDFWLQPIDEYQLQRTVAHLEQYDAQQYDYIEDIIVCQSFQDATLDDLGEMDLAMWQNHKRHELRRKLALC